MTDDIDRVIAGLTEAQRECLMAGTIAKGDMLELGVGFQLRKLGLIRADCSALNGWKITPLKKGLSVRARLQERSDALPAPPKEVG